MFDLPDSWVWDFWLVDDGTDYHLFFLYASRALKDPDARHFRASIGHAVSSDLVDWRRVADALVRSDPPAFDDLAVWTGSVVRADGGDWRLFYTGVTLGPGGNIQSVGCARSSDLYEWTREPGVRVRADPRWYETLGDALWTDEPFRDPWVVRTADGWHLLTTARANHGPADDRGVVGHATSPDLSNWTVQPPLSQPGQGFGHLEVIETSQVDGQWVVMFNCFGKDLAARPGGVRTGGIWVAPAEGPLGPFDLDSAFLFTGEDRYVGRLIPERQTGRMLFLAFRHDGPGGAFLGGVTDPVAVGWRDGRLVELGAAEAAADDSD